MPEISLTTFVDFVTAAGTPRLTKVKGAKEFYGEPYSPARDFYGPLRKRIIQTFESGWNPKEFDKLLADIDDPKKLTHYSQCRKGLRKWAGVSGMKTFEWTKPQRAVWSSQGLDVNVSPELWVKYDGAVHAIKLYFKGEPLSQQKVT